MYQLHQLREGEEVSRMTDKIDRSSCLIGFPHIFILSGTQNVTDFNSSCGFPKKFVRDLYVCTCLILDFDI